MKKNIAMYMAALALVGSIVLTANASVKHLASNHAAAVSVVAFSGNPLPLPPPPGLALTASGNPLPLPPPPGLALTASGNPLPLPPPPGLRLQVSTQPQQIL